MRDNFIADSADIFDHIELKLFPKSKNQCPNGTGVFKLTINIAGEFLFGYRTIYYIIINLFKIKV